MCKVKRASAAKTDGGDAPKCVLLLPGGSSDHLALEKLVPRPVVRRKKNFRQLFFSDVNDSRLRGRERVLTVKVERDRIYNVFSVFDRRKTCSYKKLSETPAKIPTLYFLINMPERTFCMEIRLINRT